MIQKGLPGGEPFPMTVFQRRVYFAGIFRVIFFLRKVHVFTADRSFLLHRAVSEHKSGSSQKKRVYASRDFRRKADFYRWNEKQSTDRESNHKNTCGFGNVTHNAMLVF